MIETKCTNVIYSEDGESSIFAEMSEDGSAAIFVSSSYADADIVLDSELIIEFAESLLKMARGDEYEINQKIVA